VHVFDQLALLTPEGAHHSNAGKGLADPAVDLFGVLPQRPVDWPDAARPRKAHEDDARNDRQCRQGEPPIQSHQDDDRNDQPHD
jgi:hypothetical protein